MPKFHVQTTKACVGAKVQLHTSLTQAVGGCVLCHFLAVLPVGKVFRYPLSRRIGVSHRWFWRFGKQKIYNRWGKSRYDAAIFQPVASHYTDNTISAPLKGALLLFSLFQILNFILKLSEVKWVTVKFLRIKVPHTLGWPYTEGTWLKCDYFIWVYLVLCLF
jgi:hypothetical protein